LICQEIFIASSVGKISFWYQWFRVDLASKTGSVASCVRFYNTEILVKIRINLTAILRSEAC